MNKLNFTIGLVTKLLGMALVISGLLFINILVDDNALKFSITELYSAVGITNIIILVVIEISALYYIITGAKNLVDSPKFINYEENRASRLAGSITNLVITTLLLGAETFGIIKLLTAGTNIFAVRLDILVIACALIILTLVAVILELARLTRTVNRQKRYRVPKVSRKKATKNKEPKIELKPEVAIKEEKEDLVAPRFNIGKK